VRNPKVVADVDPCFVLRDIGGQFHAANLAYGGGRFRPSPYQRSLPSWPRREKNSSSQSREQTVKSGPA
jgi:hypothetical protein